LNTTESGEPKELGKPPALYRDRWIECTPDALVIHGYYFPFGNKRTIRYDRVQEIREFEMGPLTGQARIWGSGDFRHYFHLDPRRPRKKRALIVDLGRHIRPIITPDDTARVRAIIEPRLRKRPMGCTAPRY
jgi:hypothetical protein